MVTLNSSLHSVGISQAKGVDAFILKDQLGGTLPRGKGAADQSYVRQELTPEQQQQVEELRQIDRQVREHEAAHLRAGRGVVTSGANFSYTYGPDGKQYAVAGEVGIDTSPERKPEANIDKGIRIQVAALAPRDPSPQDQRVAAIGGQLEAKGRTDLVAQQQQEAAAKAQVAAEARKAEQQQAEETPDRPLATQTPADRMEQAPNAEPVSPVANLNDAARQRVAQAYAPVGQQAETTFSVFA